MKKGCFVYCLFCLYTTQAGAPAQTDAQTHAVATLTKGLTCTITEIDDSDFAEGAINLSFYERHNENCGGDPQTSPRITTYEIDRYGRVFEYSRTFEWLTFVDLNGKKPITIHNIDEWQHPTKRVFAQYGVALVKLQKHLDGTFVVFHVNHDFLANHLPHSSSQKQRDTQHAFFNELRVANGGWDFMIMPEDGYGHLVYGTKRRLHHTQTSPHK